MMAAPRRTSTASSPSGGQCWRGWYRRHWCSGRTGLAETVAGADEDQVGLCGAEAFQRRDPAEGHLASEFRDGPPTESVARFRAMG
jgi:hypothetical protein